MSTKRRGHNEGSVRQRTDGTSEARLSLPGGKRKSLYGKTRRKVQDKLRAAHRDLDNGVGLSTDPLTIARLLDQWLGASVKPSVRLKTHEGYESIVRVRMVPHTGRKSLSRITPLEVQALFADLATTGLFNLSIQNTHRVLHHACTQDVLWG